MTVTPIPPMPDECWPVDTSCIPDWDAYDVEPDPESEDPVEQAGTPTYTPEQKALAIALSVSSLRMLTAYQVGGCPVTVRPASQGCVERTWRTYPVRGSGPWTPVSVGGQWYNIACGDHAGGCGCGSLSQINLGQASRVTEVKVDGMVLDPSAYRLDGGGWLVRLDGDRWPMCQDLSQADTEPGTWSVTYQTGAVVDGLGAWAAGRLAREYLNACSGGTCDLPDTVTQIVRQGLTMTLTPGAFPNGLTGIREVDAWVKRHNPNGLLVRSSVLSPDRRPNRRVGI